MHVWCINHESDMLLQLLWLLLLVETDRRQAHETILRLICTSQAQAVQTLAVVEKHATVLQTFRHVRDDNAIRETERRKGEFFVTRVLSFRRNGYSPFWLLCLSEIRKTAMYVSEWASCYTSSLNQPLLFLPPVAASVHFVWQVLREAWLPGYLPVQPRHRAACERHDQARQVQRD